MRADADERIAAAEAERDRMGGMLEAEQSAVAALQEALAAQERGAKNQILSLETCCLGWLCMVYVTCSRQAKVSIFILCAFCLVPFHVLCSI